jgi:hypothetical protein
VAVLLVLPALVVFGHAVAAAGIAGGIFVRTATPIGVWGGLALLAIGAVIIALVALVPYAGGVLVLLALLLGTGALTRAIGGRLRWRER